MYVLQVGIGKYQNSATWAELRGAVTDVVETRKVLEGERWGVPAANIVTLTDAEGTKQKIFEKFQSHLIANAEKQFQKTKNRREGAIILFQFSGHGSQAPDTDGDEKDDGKDETLVTVDSEDAPGKNFDITDDEIFLLTSRLRAFTDNIVYIFDSCHSGSGTRDAEDVRRIPERKNAVVTLPGFTSPTRSGDMKPADSGSGVLPPGDDYIVITAARSNQLASQKNCFEECGQTTRPVVFGNLTFFLIDELKNARSDTSYRELMENVTRRVTAEKPSQTPQIEGDVSRMVFSGLGRTEDNFIRISEGETKKPNGDRFVRIAAGGMQGVTAGTIVSFYDKSIVRFDGAEKVASGSVTAVSAAQSTVRVIGAKREIKIDDKSVIVSADLGTNRLRLNTAIDAGKLTPEQASVIANIPRKLFPGGDKRDHAEVTIANATSGVGARWDLAVLKDRYSAVAGKIGGKAPCEVPVADGEPRSDIGDEKAEVFYVAGKDYVPLYGFCMFATASTSKEQDAAARRLAEVVTHISRLKAVGAISNRRSILNGKISVRPVKLSAPFGCRDSKFTSGAAQLAVADSRTGTYSFEAGDVFWFEIINNTPYDLYLALLNMPPDGSVKLFSPRERSDEKSGVLVAKNGGKRILMSDECRVDADGNFLEAGPFRASKLTGLDHFKLIASTEPILRENLAFLEMPFLVNRDSQTGLAAKKEWTTVETILRITDTQN